MEGAPQEGPRTSSWPRIGTPTLTPSRGRRGCGELVSVSETMGRLEAWLLLGSGCHERPRWGPPRGGGRQRLLRSMLRQRTADRRHGARCGPCITCGACEERWPTGTDDSELREAAWSSRRSQRRRWEQSRSVTWLSPGRSSPHRCWRTLRLTQWTPARCNSSSRPRCC